MIKLSVAVYVEVSNRNVIVVTPFDNVLAKGKSGSDPSDVSVNAAAIC